MKKNVCEQHHNLSLIFFFYNAFFLSNPLILKIKDKRGFQEFLTPGIVLDFFYSTLWKSKGTGGRWVWCWRTES